eukprot:749446-Hanusia_phi.AAC.5
MQVLFLILFQQALVPSSSSSPVSLIHSLLRSSSHFFVPCHRWPSFAALSPLSLHSCSMGTASIRFGGPPTRTPRVPTKEYP